MKNKELYEKLTGAYSTGNLNKISLTLINLYKNGQFSILRKITDIIGDYVDIDITEDGKGFSKLMMLYHPDRANFHLGEIEKFYRNENIKELFKYSHVLQLDKIEEIAALMDDMEDIDYSPVYAWDYDDDEVDHEGFTIVDYQQPVKNTYSKSINYTFYDAVKIREYGQAGIEYPVYYLEDFEDFELSSSRINNLDGIQFCIHARSMDLSDNMIFDLSHLVYLTNLEDLDLSDNRIGEIGPLGFLRKLKTLNLSNNRIDDISPLAELENLEYVCLTGNPIHQSQIKELVNRGIAVDY